MEKAVEILDSIGKNIQYWFAHMMLKEEALTSQTISFTWLAAIMLASIPYVQYFISGNFPEKIPVIIIVYSAFWIILALIVTIINIVGSIRFTYKMMSQTSRELLKVYEETGKYFGLLICGFGGLSFIIAYIIFPKIFGEEIMTYIWLLGISGLLLGLSASSYIVWRKIRYPGFKEEGEVYLLSSILTFMALILVHFLEYHYIVKGLCATAAAILITLLSTSLLRLHANRMLNKVFGG